MELEIEIVKTFAVGVFGRLPHTCEAPVEIAEIENLSRKALVYGFADQRFQRSADGSHFPGFLRSELRYISSAVGQPPNETGVRERDKRFPDGVLADAHRLGE